MLPPPGNQLFSHIKGCLLVIKTDLQIQRSGTNFHQFCHRNTGGTNAAKCWLAVLPAGQDQRIDMV